MEFKSILRNLSLFPKKEITESFIVIDQYTFTNQSYCYVHYNDGSESLYSYPDFNLLVGQNNYDKKRIKNSVKATYDMHTSFSIDSVFHDNFKEIKEKYIKGEKYKTDIIKQELNITTHNIPEMYYCYNNQDKQFEKTWKEYNALKQLVLLECKNSKISYEKAPEEISKKIIDALSNRPSPLKIYDNTSISDCYSIEAINKGFNERIKNARTEMEYIRLSNDYMSKKLDLTDYTAEFFSNEFLLFNALVDNNFKNREQILKTYAEFLIVLPTYCQLINEVAKCSNIAQRKKFDTALSRLYNNKEFLIELNNMMDHDPKKESYHYHATLDENEAKRIINEGLYMYVADIDSTSFEELNEKQVLTYEYGGMFEHYGDYMIVFSSPVGQKIERRLSEEERANCNIVPRRIGAIGIKPSYIVESKYIVGYIDKRNCKVILNEKYKKEKESRKNI